MNFRKSLLLACCGIQFAVLHAQDHDEQPYMVKTFHGAVHKVESSTSGGNITVYGEATGDARVEVFVNSGNRHHWTKEEIDRKIAERYDLIVGLTDGKLTGDAKAKHRDGNWEDNFSISFVFHVPEAVSTGLHTSGGNIIMSHLAGTQDFATSGGNLELEALSGKITGRTSGGNVTIRDSKDNIDVSTSGGNIKAINCKGVIRLETSGGDVRLTSLQGDIHAHTSGGQVEGADIGGELKTGTSGGSIHLKNLTCSVSASTSGGNIDLSISELGKYVDLSDNSGDVTLTLPKGKGMNFDLRGESVHFEDVTNFHGNMDQHHASGSVNGGGVPVKVDGSSSSVHVSFR